MAFFNQKEEVIDIKLTQFGKNALARGAFKPVYYRFFDDGILYNSENAGFSEHQNDTEKRILEETPRLKTQHMCHGVETQYFIDDELIKDREKLRFEPLKKNVDPNIEDKILQYPLGEQDLNEEENPRFNIRSYDAEFKNYEEEIKTLDFDGVIRKVPQLTMEPVYRVVMDYMRNEDNKRITEEEHFDFMSDSVKFNSGIHINKTKQNIILDIEEVATFYGLDNFEIEVFEIEELSYEDEEGNQQIKENLKKIDSMDSLRQKFVIKTDEDVDLTEKKFSKQTNFRREEEY